MNKHTQTIRLLLPTNCLSVFDRFMGFTLKGLTHIRPILHFIYTPSKYQKSRGFLMFLGGIEEMEDWYE